MSTYVLSVRLVGLLSSSFPKTACCCWEDRASSHGGFLDPIKFFKHSNLCLSHCPAVASPLWGYLILGSRELIPASATHLETLQHKPQQGRNRSACCFPGIRQKAGHLIPRFPSFLVQTREQVQFLRRMRLIPGRIVLSARSTPARLDLLDNNEFETSRAPGNNETRDLDSLP